MGPPRGAQAFENCSGRVHCNDLPFGVRLAVRPVPNGCLPLGQAASHFGGEAICYVCCWSQHYRWANAPLINYLSTALRANKISWNVSGLVAFETANFYPTFRY